MEGPWEARGRHIGRRMAPPPTAYQTVDKQNCRRTNFTFETFVCRDRSKGQLGGPFKTMSHAGSLSCHFGGEGGRGEAQIEGSWIPVQINEYGHWAPTIKTTILYVLSLEIPNCAAEHCEQLRCETNLHSMMHCIL